MRPPAQGQDRQISNSFTSANPFQIQLLLLVGGSLSTPHTAVLQLATAICQIITPQVQLPRLSGHIILAL